MSRVSYRKVESVDIPELARIRALESGTDESWIEHIRGYQRSRWDLVRIEWPTRLRDTAA
jgi:hypothetical protein